MKKLIHLALAIAATAVCSVASAGVVTFEGLGYPVLSGGDSLSQGGVQMTVLGAADGLAGALVNGSDVNTCTVAACPTGNATTYFAGLNDGGLNLALAFGGIKVTSLDFGFLAPVPVIGLTGFGRLVLEGLQAVGSVMTSIDFGSADANGSFSFTHWNVDSSFANTYFSSVNVFACLYTDPDPISGAVACVNPASNQAQFGVDNIAFDNIALVPEPASLALVAISLGGMFVVRRRRSAPSA